MNIRHLFNETFVPATHHIILKIVDFLKKEQTKMKLFGKSINSIHNWCYPTPIPRKLFDSSRFFMDTVWILFSWHYPDTWTTWTGYKWLFQHLGWFSCLSGKKKKLEKNSKKWWKCAAALVHSWCTFHGKKYDSTIPAVHSSIHLL